jgi:hypothetical protein
VKTVLGIERVKEFSLLKHDASELRVIFYDKGDITVENRFVASPRDTIGVNQFTYYFQIIRENAQLQVKRSDDGIHFQEVLACKLPEPVLKYQQWISLTGFSWFNPARSFADWDYVRLEAISGSEER